ncbi:MAG: hypothetical protein OEZ39_12420 [Gammaproteobacteria bacterium]|nr:hypothetical protein [Gammaproteobacteria bacterium]MDH5652650.1 hypothetical protein [Gammaproteobacteria bacterium]
MRKSVNALWLAVCLCSLPCTVPADNLTVPEKQEEKPETFSVTLPGRGMTKENVLSQFGEPEKKYSAVGTPPISRWVYKGFTVYFESNYVIHAVFHTPEEN